MLQDEIEDIYELSPLQQGMLFHTLYDPHSTVYFEQTILPINGALDAELLADVWQQLMDRYAILRTSFHWEDLDKPIQVVHPKVKLTIEQEDWRNLSYFDREERFAAYLKRDRQRGFDFSTAPLMRLGLLQFADDEYQLIWSFHHILLDGWSYQILSHELWSLYEAQKEGGDPGLEPTRPYGDYINWLQEQDIARAEEYWRENLNGFTAPTPLRVDEPAPARASGEGEEGYGAHELVLSSATTSALQNLARQHRLTLNTMIQGAWALVLSRYSGERDVLFGGVVSGRPAELAGVESMVGLFINTLPVRCQVDPEMDLLRWLNQLQAQQLEAREYEYTPMLDIQRWSDLPPGVPLFESIVVFENFPVTYSGERSEEDSDVEPDFSELRYPERTNYPLCLVVVPHTELRVCFYYQERRLRAATVERIAAQYGNLLAEMATDPARPLGALAMLRWAEKRQQLIEWNRTEWKSPELDGSVTGLFARQVAHRPDAAAFFSGAEVLTYADLDKQSSQLAHVLRSRGAGRETVVGVCLERSLDVPIVLLAIWKTGAAYLPLEPALPQERLAYMLREAGAGIVVTRSVYADVLPEVRAAIALDGDAEEIAGAPPSISWKGTDPGDLAYVLFTSGSTGNPKAVAAEHRQILNRLAWMWRKYPFTAGEVCCQKTALAFIDSIWEILGGLLAGVPCAIIPEREAQDPLLLVEQLGQHGVTRLWAVPSLLAAILDTHRDLEARLPRLWFCVSSGEPLGVELWRRFYRSLPNSVLYNLYGTSEIWDATWYAPPGDMASSYVSWQVPIGRPIDNVTAYVLDGNMELLPLGAPGELYIGGMGLARGYAGRPDQTAERFVPHPFSEEAGARLYRTGDLVRYREDGTVEFLRRIDQQVKIRGFRIEPGEVETVLGTHSGVMQATVVARAGANGEMRLVAYVVPRGKGEATIAAPGLMAALREHLAQRLPEYMLPAAYVFLDALPFTRSGKIDRHRLPPPEKGNFTLANSFVAAEGDTEQRIAEIWSDILCLSPIGRHDNFFELGGHSLLATRFVSRVRDAFQVELPLRAIFEKPTLARIAEAVAEAAADTSKKATPSIVPLSREHYRVTLTGDGEPDETQLLKGAARAAGSASGEDQP